MQATGPYETNTKDGRRIFQLTIPQYRNKFVPVTTIIERDMLHFNLQKIGTDINNSINIHDDDMHGPEDDKFLEKNLALPGRDPSLTERPPQPVREPVALKDLNLDDSISEDSRYDVAYNLNPPTPVKKRKRRTEQDLLLELQERMDWRK